MLLKYWFLFRQVIGSQPQDLPDACLTDDECFDYCDICQERSEEKKQATSYCITNGCKRKFCEDHREVC